MFASVFLCVCMSFFLSVCICLYACDVFSVCSYLYISLRAYLGYYIFINQLFTLLSVCVCVVDICLCVSIFCLVCDVVSSSISICMYMSVSISVSREGGRWAIGFIFVSYCLYSVYCCFVYFWFFLCLHISVWFSLYVVVFCEFASLRVHVRDFTSCI